MKGRFVRKSDLGPEGFATSSKLHLAYVEREGVERDGSRGQLYDGNARDGANGLRQEMLAPDAREEHQFRFIISPEDAHDIDMTAYTRELMSRVEQDVGQPLVWAAVNHYNTAQPHSHVIVRGVDRNGRQVRFDREYMKHGFRHRAQGLATEWLGPRTELDLQRQSEREVEQARWTQLDRRIERKTRERGGFARRVDLDTYECRRLQFLEQLGLAQRSGEGWSVLRGWREQLRDMGERGDIIKQMHRAMPGLDSSRFVVVDDSLPLVATEGERVRGRIAELGLREDLDDGMYAVVETIRGTGYHIPLRRGQLGQLREGDLVTMRAWTDRRGLRRVSFDRHRPLSQQAAYVGPTWLDDASPSGASAFAREVARHKQQRAEFLRARGLDRSALRKHERQAVARQYADKRRSRVCLHLDGFTGEVIACHEADSGNRYWVVEGSKGVVAVRADSRGGKVVGERVRLGYSDRAGRKRVEVEIDHDRGR